MYNCLSHKILKLWFFGLIVFVGVQNQAFGFNLADEIFSKFQSFYNGGLSDEYMSRVYSPSFSKDPFGDAMSNIEDRSMQLKIAGSQYVEEVLAGMNCHMSQKKIWGILYYFVPEFRVELARSLKQSLGDYDSQKYVFDKETIEKYCKEYYVCEKAEKMGGFLSFVSSQDLISSASSQDVNTNCKEFFQEKYAKGQNNKKIVQDVKSAQLGSDKYRNESTDDSPYDIMVDLGILAKLLYQDAQEPITPVFYNIPAFSNSKKSLQGSKNSGGGGDGEGGVGGDSVSGGDDVEKTGGGGKEGDVGAVSLDGEKVLDVDGEGTVDGKILTDVKAISLTSNINMEKEYDELVEGLGSYGVVNDDSEFYSSLCEDKDQEAEPEPNVMAGDSGVATSNVDSNVFSEVRNKEYQELIDYMINAVDQYSALPEDKQKEVLERAGDKGYLDTSPSERDGTIKKIGNCYKSCEGLRIDQKASCMVKCTCGEWESPIFDPDKVPGLGPIFIVRFCAVPAVNTKYSVGGKKIHSIEEGLNEIYGVVDQLAREGKLGKWTQQNEFLDSSTRQMNVVDTFAFTIDLEVVDISGKPSKHSEQYVEKKMKTDNNNWKTAYGVSNQLNNPATKNAFTVVGNHSLSDLDKRPEPMVDFVEDARANRSNLLENSLFSWLQQQGVLWVQASEYLSDFIDYSSYLYSKKCDKS